MARIKDVSPNSLNLTGNKFGEWVVTDKKFGASYLCICSCGTEKIIQSQTIKRGSSKSCGCKGKDWCRRHGMEGTLTYNTWSAVKQRCHNPESNLYKNYGGRGIKMFQEWYNDFSTFYKDMGEKPIGFSLDRIDPNGNYEPGNCRWASSKQQARNKRNTVYLSYKGERKPLAELAEIHGIKRKIVEWRLKNGWSVEDALEKAIRC